MRTLLYRAFIPSTWAERIFWLIVAIPSTILVWQALDRGYPVTTRQRQLITPAVAAGDFLKIRYTIQQHNLAESTIYRRLYDGFGIVLDYAPETQPPRMLQENPYTQAIQIPSRAEPGKAKMVITVCWQRPFNIVHQLWPVCRTLPGLEFLIVKSK